MLRKRLSQPKNQLPEVQVDIDIAEENIGNHQTNAVVESANVLKTPSLTCIHNNDMINIGISDKKVNNNSNGNIAV